MLSNYLAAFSWPGLVIDIWFAILIWLFVSLVIIGFNMLYALDIQEMEKVVWLRCLFDGSRGKSCMNI